MGKRKVWVVVFLVHVHIPYQHILNGVVRNVPNDATERDVEAAVEAAGYTPGEFGIPWANHYVEPLKDAEPQVKGAYRRKMYEWEIDYEEVMDDSDLE